MPFFIGGILILLVLVAAGRAFVNADPKKLGRFVSWFFVSLAVIGAATILILLMISERLGPALALVGFLAPVLVRTKSIWRRWLSAAGPSAGNVSEVETSYLRMRLDHDTGAMSGTVRHGRFAGRRLDELTESELMEFWRDCRVGDEASARLMESYLDRLRPDWRAAASGGADAGAGAGPRTTADAMTRDEAYAVLGLSPGADEAAIKKAHRDLMMKLHPDQGGSTYLAAKINRAKEILLA
jgi:hypothetical protein